MASCALWQPAVLGSTASLHGIGKGTGHGHGVLRQGHGRVQQHAVIAPFHDLARVRWQAQACIHQQWHAQPLTQGLQRVRVHRPSARANGRSPGHDGLAADIDQALAQHQVFGAVGQHLKAFLDEVLGRAHQVQRVGLQGVVVADQFQLDPRGVEHFAGHLGGGDGFLGAVAARGIGKHGHIELAQQLPEAGATFGWVAALAAQRGGDHGGLGAFDGGLKHSRRGVPGGPQQQAAGEGVAVKDQRIWRGKSGHGLLGRQPPVTGEMISTRSPGCKACAA